MFSMWPCKVCFQTKWWHSVSPISIPCSYHRLRTTQIWWHNAVCQMLFLMLNGPIIHMSSVAIQIMQELDKYSMQSISQGIQSLLSVCLQENFISLEPLAQDLFYVAKAYFNKKACKSAFLQSIITFLKAKDIFLCTSKNTRDFLKLLLKWSF